MKKIIFLLSFQLSVFGYQYSFCQWQQTSCPTESSIESIVIMGTNIFAGTNGDGVFLSTDNGGSWEAKNTNLPEFANIWSIAMMGDTIFAGTAGTTNEMYLSTNNGTSWTTTGFPSYTPARTITIKGSDIFAGTDDGIWLSTDNGDTWAPMNTGLPNSTTIMSLVQNDTNIFAGTFNNGVYLSTNNGTSWKAMNNGLSDLYINTLTISGATIYAGTDEGGIYLSTDNGGNWKAVNNGLDTSFTVSAIIISGTNTFAGLLGGGVYLSTNNGQNWKAENRGLTDTNVTSLAINGTYLFAGTNTTGIWKRSLLNILGVNEVKNQNSTVKIQIYPNPVNQSSVISYQLSEKGPLNISIYDLTGREVSVLENEEREKGNYTINYNTQNLPGGVYFCRIVAGTNAAAIKMVVVH